MKVPSGKLSVCPVSYPGQGQGDRALEAPGTTVHLRWTSKPTGPNPREPRAGLESEDVDADPPQRWGRPVGEIKDNRSRLSSTGVLRGASREGSSWNRGRSTNLLEVGEVHSTDKNWLKPDQGRDLTSGCF